MRRIKGEVIELEIDPQKSLLKIIKDGVYDSVEMIFDDKHELADSFLGKHFGENIFEPDSPIVKKSKISMVINFLDKELCLSEEKEIKKMKVELFPLSNIISKNERASLQQIDYRIKNLGLQSVGIKEIASLGAQHMNLQEKSVICTLDYFWKGSLGCRIQTCLYSYGSKRGICIRNFEGFSREDLIPIVHT